MFVIGRIEPFCPSKYLLKFLSNYGKARKGLDCGRKLLEKNYKDKLKFNMERNRN